MRFVQNGFPGPFNPFLALTGNFTRLYQIVGIAALAGVLLRQLFTVVVFPGEKLRHGNQLAFCLTQVLQISPVFSQPHNKNAPCALLSIYNFNSRQ